MEGNQGEIQNPQQNNAPTLTEQAPPAMIAQVPGEVKEALDDLHKGKVKIPEIGVNPLTVDPSGSPPPAESGSGGGLLYNGEPNPDWTPGYSNQGEDPQDPNGARHGHHSQEDPIVIDDPTNQTSNTGETTIAPPAKNDSLYKIFMPMILKAKDAISRIIAPKPAPQIPPLGIDQPVLPPDEDLHGHNQYRHQNRHGASGEPPVFGPDETERIKEQNTRNQAELDRVRNGRNGGRLDRRF